MDACISAKNRRLFFVLKIYAFHASGYQWSSFVHASKPCGGSSMSIILSSSQFVVLVKLYALQFNSLFDSSTMMGHLWQHNAYSLVKNIDTPDVG